MNDTQILRSLMESMQKTSQPKTSAYDTTAEVRRIEDGVAWVHIAGGVDETPVKLTINAKEGDTVQVRVSGGTAFLVGNGTAPPTDDTRANIAQNTAVNAQIAADTAIEDAERAKEAADSAQASADSAAASAEAAQTSANNAQTSANAAQVSANNANEYASRALGGLSTVQSVTETLNWITQHGTMEHTSDQTLDPTHVYFVQDAQGDYVVGNVHYSIVTEPSADDLSTYYVLSIDESLQNYVGTHLAVTDEGLWVLPAATGYKVLIATGQGQTYTTAGTYIIDASGNTVARFGQTVQIGEDGQSRLILDYHSLKIIDRNTDEEFFHVSDLRNSSGIATLEDSWMGDGDKTYFDLSCEATDTAYDVYVDDVLVTPASKTTGRITFTTAPSDGSVIKAIYQTASDKAKAYTLGVRGDGTVGAMSVANGDECDAIGYASSAEGFQSVAQGRYAHAGGYCSKAIGNNSFAYGALCEATQYSSVALGYGCHTEGYYPSVAIGYDCRAIDLQTVIGRYNALENNKQRFIIGNGYSNSSRSNALTVDYTGNIFFALATNMASGTDHDLYAAITALGWESEVIV